MTTTLPVAPPRHGLPRTGWAGYAAAAFAAGYGVNALLWSLAGEGYPFGASHQRSELLRSVPAAVGAPVLTAILVAAAVLAFAMSGPYAVRVQGAPRRLLLGAGWGMAAVLAVGVPTTAVLALIGSLPLLVLGAPFGWPAGVDVGALVDRSLVNQLICVVAGLLLARAVLEWQRRTRDACSACGRPAGTSRAGLADVGEWVVAATPVVVLGQAVVRGAGALHVPPPLSWLEVVALAIAAVGFLLRRSVPCADCGRPA
jgi:hypothetical protein